MGQKNHTGKEEKTVRVRTDGRDQNLAQPSNPIREILCACDCIWKLERAEEGDSALGEVPWSDALRNALCQPAYWDPGLMLMENNQREDDIYRSALTGHRGNLQPLQLFYSWIQWSFLYRLGCAIGARHRAQTSHPFRPSTLERWGFPSSPVLAHAWE